MHLDLCVHVVQWFWLHMQYERRFRLWQKFFFFSDETRHCNAKLCLVILTCIAEVRTGFFLCRHHYWSLIISIFFKGFHNHWRQSTSSFHFKFKDQYANSLMHDVNINFRVTLHRMVGRLFPIITLTHQKMGFQTMRGLISKFLTFSQWDIGKWKWKKTHPLAHLFVPY